VTVSLQCTTPTYPATGSLSVQTQPDGSYSFANVPVGASCTITETQPAGYTNAYNTMGAGGTSQSGAVAGSSTDSVINLTVPVTGSSGNNFAEQSADMVSTVVCLPNPAPAGTTVTCTVTCTNHGPGAAVGAVCQTVGSLPTSASTTCPVSGNVLNGDLLRCTVTYTATSHPVTITVGTGADNDTNGGSNPSAGNNPSQVSVSEPAAVPLFSPFALLLLGLLVAAGALRSGAKRSRVK
jgi:hypothetical protein